MPISCRCSCGKTLRIKEELIGKRIKCSSCRQVQVIHQEPSVSVPKARGRIVALMLIIVGFGYFTGTAIGAAFLLSVDGISSNPTANIGAGDAVAIADYAVATADDKTVPLRAKGPSARTTLPASLAHDVVAVNVRQARRSQESFAPFFDFPSEQGISEKGRSRAIAYLSALSARVDLAAAVEVVCPPELLEQQAILKTCAANVTIDGNADDWGQTPTAIDDERGNVNPYHKKKRAAEPSGNMDLACVKCILEHDQLLLCFATHDQPAARDTAYSLQMYNAKGEMVYLLVAGRRGCSMQYFVDGKNVRSAPLPKQWYEVQIGNVVEVRLSRNAIPRLGDRFRACGLSFNAKKNLANFTKVFPVRATAGYAATTQARLLAHYAERTELQQSGAVPLALCLSESYLLENADPVLYDRIVNDGLEMLDVAHQVKQGLKGMPFSALLAWTNRSLMWGGLSGLMLDDNGAISPEAYDFMILRPHLLADVRNYLINKGIGKQASTSEVVEAINTWAKAGNRYRWKPKDMRRWAKADPVYWGPLYKATLADVQAGKEKVCTINGKQIEFYYVGSPNLDWKLYRQNGFYYGCCGDVATMSMLACKSLGIADICVYWHFPKEQQMHTFLGFYDREANQWRVPASQRPPRFQPSAKGILLLSLPPLTKNRPDQHKVDIGHGAVHLANRRTPLQHLSVSAIRLRLNQGFTSAEVRAGIFRQVAGKKGSGTFNRNGPKGAAH